MRRERGCCFGGRGLGLMRKDAFLVHLGVGLFDIFFWELFFWGSAIYLIQFLLGALVEEIAVLTNDGIYEE